MEWQKKIQYLLQRLLHLLGQCDLCGGDLNDNLNNVATPSQTLLCDTCLSELPVFKLSITQWDLLNWPAINKALPNIHFDHLFCLSPYLTPFNHWLPQFKYQGRFELASFFALLLAQQWQSQPDRRLTSSVDLVLSVPLNINKWQTRGYNQAHLIAKKFAQHIDRPYDGNVLIRTKKNKSQVGQTGRQRRKNLDKAFKLTKALPKNSHHVILLDDVLTTGSTASEISKLLKGYGVVKITIVTVCLTLPN